MADRMTAAQALVAYGRAWFVPDHDARVEALRACCTDDIAFVDGAGRYEGLDEVAKMIGSFSSASPAGADTDAAGAERASEGRDRGRSGANGVQVDVVTGIEEMGSFFRYSFVWTLPDGSRVPGTDVCEVAADGRMKLITVWPANDDFPLPDAAR
jgi:hypothetical protein